MPGKILVVLGAESTGKTSLCEALVHSFAAQGRRVSMVSEYLREFCAHQGRTPRREEQADIAAEQTRRIREAATLADLVIADTSALMIAVYSQWYFADTSLFHSAREFHAEVDAVLLMGLDLPWVADGIQREGPQVQAGVDARVRLALDEWGQSYQVILGKGEQRSIRALAAAQTLWRAAPEQPGARWRWYCPDCGPESRLACMHPG